MNAVLKLEGYVRLKKCVHIYMEDPVVGGFHALIASILRKTDLKSLNKTL